MKVFCVSNYLYFKSSKNKLSKFNTKRGMIFYKGSSKNRTDRKNQSD